MDYSLDTPSTASFKAEARALREERAKAGDPITHSAALEQVARRHGYRDWNTAAAAVPARAAIPVQVGQRVRGLYLGRSFVGSVLGVQLLADMQHYKVVVQFDQPVDVSRSALMSIPRHRVTATIDLHGVSPARTSDGEPHMRLGRL
jgi:hypothetical protein